LGAGAEGRPDTDGCPAGMNYDGGEWSVTGLGDERLVRTTIGLLSEKEPRMDKKRVVSAKRLTLDKEKN